MRISNKFIEKTDLGLELRSGPGIGSRIGLGLVLGLGSLSRTGT